MSGAMLYVHVPFCVSKCAYCDFASIAGADLRARAAYLETVRRHTSYWCSVGMFEGGARSLYVGGGTPTSIGDELVELIGWLRGTVGLAPGAEVTVETNPETTDDALITALTEVGVNRFSLGVQSFDEPTLRRLGRCHDAHRAEQAAAVLARSGMPFSVDLICGVPGLESEAWVETLERAVATGAGHVSVYPLAIEEGTPLARDVASGASPDTDPDRAAADMLAAVDVLCAAGIARYEVANHARPGQESRHNTGYWTGAPYVGIGPSAAGMLPADMLAGTAFADRVPTGGRVRFAYPGDIEAWLAADPSAPDAETLTADERRREDVMLGMRMAAGVPEALVADAGLIAVFESLADDDLVTRREGRWATTARGWLLGNEVFGRVLFD